MAKVLVLDSSRTFRPALDQVLTDLGHTVLPARNVAEALALSNLFFPELVFAEWADLRPDGVSFANLVAKQLGPRVPIIFMTTGGRVSADFEQPTGWLFKPFSIEELIEQLQVLFVEPRVRGCRSLPVRGHSRRTARRGRS